MSYVVAIIFMGAFVVQILQERWESALMYLFMSMVIGVLSEIRDKIKK